MVNINGNLQKYYPFSNHHLGEINFKNSIFISCIISIHNSTHSSFPG